MLTWNLACPMILLLCATGCTDKAKENASAGTQSANTSFNGIGPLKAGLLPDLIYIHCLGNDYHVKGMIDVIQLSLSLDENNLQQVRERNLSSKEYYPVCYASDYKCNIDVDATQIYIEADQRPTNEISFKTSLRIDRRTGHFVGVRTTKTASGEITDFSGDGQCEKSENPEPPSAI